MKKLTEDNWILLQRKQECFLLLSPVLNVTLNNPAYLLGNCCKPECTIPLFFSFISSVVKPSAPQ